jgi:Pretoxin HINT domain
VVWSHDEATGETSEQRVARTFITPDQPIFKVMLQDDKGRSEGIRTTGEHPFWVVNKGWTSAQHLQAGDLLFQLSGGWLRVGSATWAQERATVYNFEVENTHSYFVGELGALVHNSCWEKLAEHVADRFPGKSKEKIIAYLERFASTVKGTPTNDGPTIWRKGLEILIHRPDDLVNGGGYFFADTKAQARSYVERFILKHGGVKL